MTTTTIDPRITKARVSLLADQPFFGTLALYLRVVEDEGYETMATDGEQLFYAPSFLSKITPRELVGVWAHEVLHCAYQHHLRRQHREPELWNIACDYAVNRDLLAAGFALPKGALHDPRFRGMGAEDIYAVLDKERRQKKQQQGPGAQGQQQAQSGQGAGQQPSPGQQPGQGASQGASPSQGGQPGQGQGSSGQGQGQPSVGSGAGSRQLPGACMGRVLDGPRDPARAAAQQMEWQRRVVQAVGVAKARNFGTLPGHFRELIEDVERPRVDWRERLREFIDSRCDVDYSWSRPNRRFAGRGFIMPGTENDAIGKLGVVLDTSGSIDRELLAKFASELQAQLDDGLVSEMVVIQCDTMVHQVDRFMRGDRVQIDALGRGGTNFSPALQWFNENEGDVAALIYFTDMCTSDFGQEPACPLLWAAYDCPANQEAPFGEIVRVQ